LIEQLIQQYITLLNIPADKQIVRDDVQSSDYFWWKGALQSIGRLSNFQDHIVTLDSGEKCVQVTPENSGGRYPRELCFVIR
jgi:hypothetical protein